MAEAPGAALDLAFALGGRTLPREHRQGLAAAVERVLPWLADCPGAGLHRLNVAAGAGPLALLSRHTRLTLRLPRECVADAAALAGAELDIGGHRLVVGAPQRRELRAHGTLYAHLVAAADAGDDELGFVQSAQAELAALGVPCRPICGRHQVTEAGTLRGYSLMLDGLSAAGAMAVLENGLGRHRRLGCGLFVPHRSAAAVGAPS